MITGGPWVPRLLLFVLLLLPAYLRAQAARTGPWHIVVLVGTDTTQPTAARQLQTLRAELTKQLPQGVEIFIDPLDTLRFEKASLEAPFMDLMKRKYANQHVDLVIGLADFSVNFVARYHERIWPNAPVLISSVPVRRMQDQPLLPGLTYLPFHIDIEGTLGLVDALQPSLKRLVVITGATRIDQNWIPYIQNAASHQFKGKWNVELWSGLPQAELLRRASSLSNDTAILFTTMYRDRDGHSYVPADVAKALTSTSPVPVYGWYGSFDGIVGGSLVDFAGIARQTALVSTEILNRTRETGGVLPFVRSECIVNIGRLKSFGLKESAIPSGCDGINYPPSLWRDHPYLVAAVLATLALQTCTIFALLWQRRRRYIAEQTAAQRANELTRATRIASVGEMSAAITHEISQPLGAIVSNADAAGLMFANDPVDTGEIRDIVGDIQRDAMRASQILNRQRALMHKVEIKLVPLAADQALEDGIALLIPEARRRGCRLAINLAARHTHVKADRIQLQQVFLNLAINAMDAMQKLATDRRQMTVATHAIDGWWVMEVTDAGTGIDTDALPHIFESFYTTKAGGTGLGLSIVRTIVTSHEGTVSVTSTGNQGTTFEIRLLHYH